MCIAEWTGLPTGHEESKPLASGRTRPRSSLPSPPITARGTGVSGPQAPRLRVWEDPHPRACTLCTFSCPHLGRPAQVPHQRERPSCLLPPPATWADECATKPSPSWWTLGWGRLGSKPPGALRTQEPSAYSRGLFLKHLPERGVKNGQDHVSKAPGSHLSPFQHRRVWLQRQNRLLVAHPDSRVPVRSRLGHDHLFEP